MTSDYLESVKKQFEYYKLLGEKTFDQVSDEQLFFKPITKVIALPPLLNI